MRFKKLYESAVTPTRGSDQAAGYDLYACGYEDQRCDDDMWSVLIPPGSTLKINTGIAVELPKCAFGGVFPRSGLACKFGLAPANKVGVVDSDYRGEIIVCLYNQASLPQVVHKGDRIAQFIIIPYIATEWEEVDELSGTERGAGGFGSTGK